MRPAAVSPDAAPAARRTLRRFVLVPSWFLLGALTLAFAAGLDVPERLQYAPFALSLLLFGLPHGAEDHLVPGRLSGGVTPRSMLGVTLLYLSLGSLYLALWFVAPVVAFAAFIALTWFHWGQGDLYSLRVLLRADHLKSAPQRVLAVAVRGGLPMLVPLLFFPEAYEGVARGAIRLFDPSSAGPSLVFGTAFRALAGLAFAALVISALALGYRRSGANGASFLADGAETLLLAAYFAVVPPVLAVGLYFCLWHAPRHIARLMLLEKTSTSALEAGRVAPALRSFARDAAPLTLAALALLVGLYLAAPGRAELDGIPALLALYLVLISILTLPHTVIVCLMDQRQGLWR